MKYRIGMFGLGEGDFEPYKRMHKFLKGNLTFLNQQAPLNNIFININKNILPNIQQMQIALSFLKTYTGSIKMMLKKPNQYSISEHSKCLIKKGSWITNFGFILQAYFEKKF